MIEGLIGYFADQSDDQSFSPLSFERDSDNGFWFHSKPISFQLWTITVDFEPLIPSLS